MLFKVLVTASIIAILAGFAKAARADEYLKCTQQAINPYKGKPMSAGLGPVWIKRSGDTYTSTTEFEFNKEMYQKLSNLKK
jgi:hypothetical protein